MIDVIDDYMGTIFCLWNDAPFYFLVNKLLDETDLTCVISLIGVIFVIGVIGVIDVMDMIVFEVIDLTCV